MSSTQSYAAASTVAQDFDEENVSAADLHAAVESAKKEVEMAKSKSKRESFYEKLHGLRPATSNDTRLIDVATLNEDSTKTNTRMSVRELLKAVNKAIKGKNPLLKALQDGALNSSDISLSPAVQSALRKWTHKSRRNTSSAAGDNIPELQIRDLRQMGHFDHQEEPYLLVRRHCVLISLGPQIRVIVQSHRMLVLTHHETESEEDHHATLHKLTEVLGELLNDTRMSVELSDANLPFEVKAYSAVFSLYHSLLSKEYATHAENSRLMVAAIGSHTMLSVKLQEFMHSNHDSVVDLQTKLSSTTKMISALLENETDLLFMNLKAAEKNHAIYELDTEKVEIEVCTIFPDMEAVVESILVDFRTIERKTDVMVRKLEHLEESINMKLSTSCNELLFASTIMSVFGTVIGFGGYVTGAFGMNLDNTEKIQTTPGWFAGVCSSTLFLIIFGSLAIIAVFYHFSYLPTHAHMFHGKHVPPRKELTF